METRYRTTTLLTISLLVPLVLAKKNTRFHNFWPIYRDQFTEIRDGPCAELFARKEAGEEVCRQMLDCMLDYTPESIKGDLASGVVALGLVPTILTFLGSTTAETVLLARRRPILALLVAAGAPSVNPLRLFVYPNPMKQLRAMEGHKAPTYFTAFQAGLVSLVEYVLVMAAVANVYTACYYTGDWTINTISCDDNYYQIIWAVATIAVHLGGIFALGLRVRTVYGRGWDGRSFRGKIWGWVWHEVTPCVVHEKLVLAWKPETFFFIGVNWLVSVTTVVHVLYGTIAFSSLQFLGYTDSLRVIGRLFASTIVCRAVLMFELAGMRNAHQRENEESDYPLQSYSAARRRSTEEFN